jgi:hypothetical protein
VTTARQGTVETVLGAAPGGHARGWIEGVGTMVERAAGRMPGLEPDDGGSLHLVDEDGTRAAGIDGR